MNSVDTAQEGKSKFVSIIMVALAVIALASIAYGSWLVYKPCGFLVPGMLIWIDISRMKGG